MSLVYAAKKILSSCRIITSEDEGVRQEPPHGIVTKCSIRHGPSTMTGHLDLGTAKTEASPWPCS